MKKEALRPKIGSKRRFVSDYGLLAETFLQKYMDDSVDKIFGIRYESGKFMIGDIVIKIQGDNIEIDAEMYMGTPGLWALITEGNLKEYPFEDYEWYKERYKELLYGTNVLYRDYYPRSYPRGNKSKKWTKILRPIWEDFQREGIVSDDDDEEEEYHSTMLGDGLYRTYLQKNGRCFSVSRRYWTASCTASPVSWCTRRWYLHSCWFQSI